MAEDMAAFGVTDFHPPDWMAEEKAPEEFGVLGENWEAVHVFFACATQWRHRQSTTVHRGGGVSVSDQIVGLPYDVVDVVMRRMRIVDPDDAFWRVRVMESAALRAIAKNRNT